jgi:hypothetical protein
LSRLQHFTIIIAAFFTWIAVQAEQVSTEDDGLYYLSSDPAAPEARTEPEIWTDGAVTIRVGEKASIEILKAFVYSENNANTEFGIRLNTSDYPVDPKSGKPSNPVVLKVGNHWYSCFGWGGKSGGPDNFLVFKAHNQDDAEAIAKSLAVPCHLRFPPGYKMFAQFLPLKTAYGTNEPIVVTFKIQNLDERTIIFQRGGMQRGLRDNQYGFRAQLSNRTGLHKAVPDVGNAMSFGGISGHVPIKPGETFEDQIDLKKWFPFDQAGNYYIHGFYYVEFYRTMPDKDTFSPATELWSDYLSADFTIVVK